MEKDEFLTSQYKKLWAEAGLEEPIRPRLRRAPRRKKDAPAPASLRSMQSIVDWIGDCTRCGLCEGRNNIVIGDGNKRAELMFVGEAPGADEDKTGLPFVGRAGKLLNKIIEAMGFERKDVYIANIVKCRPPNNRPPQPEEVSACIGFLHAQIKLVRPKVIVCLGASAAKTLLQTEENISAIRGTAQELVAVPELDVKVMPTFHPAYLLRNPSAKKTVWQDMKKVKTWLA